MQPIAYSKKRIFDWNDSFLLLSWACIFAAVAQMSPLLYGELHSVFSMLLFLALAAVFFRMALPRHNQLQLDKDGLTYKRAGQRGAWPWRDISAFTIARGWRGPRIAFTVSGRHGRRWRNAPLRRTKAGLTGTIPNIWDTPSEEIAATLNAYRERALGASGGSTSAGVE